MSDSGQSTKRCTKGCRVPQQRPERYPCPAQAIALQIDTQIVRDERA